MRPAHPIRGTCLLLLPPALGGCTSAPSISVLGAYFPGWMFCIVGAIATTGFLQALLRKRFRNDGQAHGMTILAYIAATTTLALAGWIVFFKN